MSNVYQSERPTQFTSTLLEHRKKANLSQRAVANELGISTVYYSDVEAGRKPAFPIDGKVSYAKLALVLKCDRAALERISGASRNEGYDELLRICEATKEALLYGRSPSDPIYIAYFAMQERGAGALPELARLVRTREETGHMLV